MNMRERILAEEAETVRKKVKKGWLNYWWGHIGHEGKRSQPKISGEGWFIDTLASDVPFEISQTLRLINAPDKEYQEFEEFEAQKIVRIITRRSDLSERLGFTPMGIVTLFRPSGREGYGILINSNCIVASKSSLKDQGYENEEIMEFRRSQAIVKAKEIYSVELGIVDEPQDWMASLGKNGELILPPM